jgi:hypothetical protein
MWFYSRSAKSTANGLATGFNKIRAFEEKFQISTRPSVYGWGGHSEVVASWLTMQRASEVKVQSISSVYSAFALAVLQRGRVVQIFQHRSQPDPSSRTRGTHLGIFSVLLAGW